MSISPFVSAGIILSYRCSSRCRHCLYCCSNKWTDWMPLDRLEAIYQGTRATVGRPRGFHLAGGEAFLNFPLLLEAVRLATAHGIPLDHVETNAHWYTTHAEAVAQLTALREAGLPCLLISASPFHAEYVPLEKTWGTIRAAREVFGERGTFVWLPEFLRALSALVERGTLPFERYAERCGPEQAREAAAYGGQLVPGGRSGFALADYLPKRPLAACLGESCAPELLGARHGHYDLYGNMLPASCAGISLGDATDLPRLCRTFTLDDRPVLRALVQRGVAGLLALAEEAYGFTPQPTYAGKCHLCMDIRRHLVACGAAFAELAPRQMYEEI